MIVQGRNRSLWFAGSVFVMANLHSYEAPGAVPVPYAIVADVNASGLPAIVANRNSQIASVYQQSPAFGSVNHVLEFGGNLNVDFAVATRFLALDISNWGIVMQDDRGDRVNLAGGPLGQLPSDVFDTGHSGLIDIPDLNDAGIMVFESRPNNGAEEIHTRASDGSLALLPSVNQAEIYTVFMSEQGSVIARVLFTAPMYEQKIFRYDAGTGWTNLTDGKLPPSTVIPSSTSVVGNRQISANGDFVFPGQVTLPNGKKQWKVLLYDNSEQTIVPILDQSSQHTDFFGNPITLNAYTTMGDHGEVWSVVRGTVFPFPGEFKTLYRNAGGQAFDLASLLPAGLTLRDHEEFHAMNFAGDVWLGAINNTNGLFSYFLYSHGSMKPILQATTLDITGATLTNSLDLYFWLYDGNSSDLAVLHLVPEPSAGALAMLLAASIQSMRRRRIDAEKSSAL